MTNHKNKRPRPTIGNVCRHGNRVCALCIVVTDAAKRMSDLVNAMVTFTSWDELQRGWMAFKLADGNSDCVLYGSRADAVAHQLHETMCAYLCMRQAMGGVTPKDCQIYLNVHRQIYDAGGRFTEPQSDIIMSTYGYDVLTGKIDPYDRR